MTDICVVFEVHQPFRLNKRMNPGETLKRRLSPPEFFDTYFDNSLNRMVLERAAKKCYLPANDVLLEQLVRFKEEKRFKVAFNISGVYIEQCRLWAPEVIDSFKRLSETGCVEFLGQTYYHGLASLFEDKREFIEQVHQHKKMVREVFGQSPTSFANTEFLYNDIIAETVAQLGFNGILTEGVERILGWRSPNYVYRPAGLEKIKLLMRNYRLSDDIGFRFTSKWWMEWPLTADKYAAWLAHTPGQCINICLDYETFGEHHWPESGIHEFLRHLPNEVLKHEHLKFLTPTEVAQEHEAMDDVQVPDTETVSWADLERDTSAWLGNEMQQTIFHKVASLEEPLKRLSDPQLMRMWRLLQTSDNYYYMFMGAGGPGVVHSYFSHFGSPADAYLTFSEILFDFSYRIGLRLGGTSSQ